MAGFRLIVGGDMAVTWVGMGVLWLQFELERKGYMAAIRLGMGLY